MNEVFLDTNIFIRFLTADDSKKEKECLALFEAIENKKILAKTSSLNIAEICYVLTSPKNHYNYTRNQIVTTLIHLLNLKNLSFEEKTICLDALIIYEKFNKLGFEDAYIIAQAKALNIDNICSYDTGFDQVKQIHRLEPREALF